MPPLPRRIAVFVSALALLLAPAGARAAMSIYMTPEDLAARASRIVEADVVATASGFDPQTGALSTYVTLDVTTVHRGPAGRIRLTLREAGGRFGNLVHEVDAVPIYRVGERVFVFLDAADDGALRTTGMFFGKFGLDPDSGVAFRDLEGQGRILHRPPVSREKLSRGDLVAVASAVAPLDRDANAGREAPPEIDRLAFGEGRDDPAKFAALSAAYPTRWDDAGAGLAVLFDIERARNPLNSGPAAVAEVQRAMASWTEVPESRLVIASADTDAAFTAAHPHSPTAVQPGGANIVLFGDPYNDISNSGTCSGVVAIGGYWRSTSASSAVNGIQFYAARYAYVIFNDGLDCFLGNPDNLAEIAAHELGHAVGFGHSAAPDSIMRATAYGFRGPRLGDDDRDGAHCHYPHSLSVAGPDAGTSWEAGGAVSIRWSTTSEDGPDAGTVDLEYQFDDGPWQPIVRGTANDGLFAWSVPQTLTASARLRVIRPNRTVGLSPEYPGACSAATTAPFGIIAPPPVPGQIDAGAGSGLRLDKAVGDHLRLSWSPSCSAASDGYAIYEADLGALRLGRFHPQPLMCDAGPDRVEYVGAPAGDRFYLVAPLAGGYEGGYGRGSNGPRATPDVRCGAAVGVDYCD